MFMFFIIITAIIAARLQPQYKHSTAAFAGSWGDPVSRTPPFKTHCVLLLNSPICASQIRGLLQIGWKFHGNHLSMYLTSQISHRTAMLVIQTFDTTASPSTFNAF
ncbi:hypothetical protein ILYODFUR_025567 [Ilyodon furcidens]|uniref:Secreted protein n=1 Tax=Ilyodon furcidens TaxID=33524 RepID=A0ABV0SP84_9TELE